MKTFSHYKAQTPHFLIQPQFFTKYMLYTYVCHMEKEMATHSSILAWRIPGTEEPGGLPFTGLHRVGHDWRNIAAAYMS